MGFDEDTGYIIIFIPLGKSIPINISRTLWGGENARMATKIGQTLPIATAITKRAI